MPIMLGKGRHLQKKRIILNDFDNENDDFCDENSNNFDD